MNSTKNRSNLLNDENLSQLTQQSADILKPILQFNIILSTFFILLILLDPNSCFKRLFSLHFNGV